MTEDFAVKEWVKPARMLLHPFYKRVPNYGVPESWLAGLVFVENASLDPMAHRFEPGVFAEIKRVSQGHLSRIFPGFNQPFIRNFIRNATEDTLRDMASSWGLGQIMGYDYFLRWHVLPNRFTELTFLESVNFTLHRMSVGIEMEVIGYSYEKLLRWWNTGHPDGETYSPTYVSRAIEARNEYERLEVEAAETE